MSVFLVQQQEVGDPYRIRVRAYLVSTACLILISVINFSGDGDSPIIGAFILFVVGVVALLWTNIYVTTLLFFPIYSLVAVVISTLTIENGAYVAEQFRFGHQNGASILAMAYSLGLFLVAHISVSFAVNRSKSIRCRLTKEELRKLGNATILMMGLLFLIFVSVIVIYGTATGSRFDYWDQLNPISRYIVQAARLIVGPVVSLAAFCFFLTPEKRTRKWLAFFILLAQLPLLFMGDKFSPFLVAAAGIFVGWALAQLFSNKAFKVTLSTVLVVTLLVAVVAFFLFIGQERQFAASGTSFDAWFEVRFSLQGHVWWGLVDLWDMRQAPLVELSELIGPNSLANPTGLDRLSFLVSRYGYVESHLLRGASFTMGGPAAPLALLGPVLGFFVYALLGLLYSVQFGVVLYSLKRKYFITAFIGLLFTHTVTAVVLMGYWSSLYGAPAIAFVLAAGTLLFRKKANNKDADSSLETQNLPKSIVKVS